MDKFNFSGHCSRVVAVIGAHCRLLVGSKRARGKDTRTACIEKAEGAGTLIKVSSVGKRGRGL